MKLTITPYLLFDGAAQQAVRFYQEHLEAELLGIEYVKDWPGELGVTLTPELAERIMHAHLKIGQSEVMLADCLPDQTPQAGSAINLMLDVQDATTAQTLFNKLQSGGKVIIPLQETGFSPAFGQVSDPFGVEWQIITAFPESV